MYDVRLLVLVIEKSGNEVCEWGCGSGDGSFWRVNVYANKDLKFIAESIPLGKHISFHTSRHTWATRALRKGMRIEYVSRLMGHASIRTTQVYAKIVNEDLDKAMDVFDE